jgi:hypothetical protein
MTSAATSTPTVCRVAALGAYATVGAAVELARWLPKAVEQRRTHIDQRITVARFIGKLAVQQASVEIRKRFTTPAEPMPSSQPAPTTEGTVVPITSTGSLAPRTNETDSTTVGSTTAPVPEVGELALEGYDELTAAQVVSLLDHLDPDELDAIDRYERAHRRRRTVLHRIGQLQDATG